ncbi:rho guanine nucleotide exchange factor 11 isoform X1 [Pieris rapae]|uniref:rho guanine nucleotide exchange factor 11 isoform X1 n=1 Tax=Pieris rapae TaxID=64459 RepID=UPI001E27C5E3|nr:rho guanine nucleotide exchange factor 11 isoform X1 [Pieris rapae]XP_045487365.1 rho guanine nucleotide exchange factor 11 isoform X1 [Pieris rapae]
MFGGTVGAVSPTGEDLLTVTVVRDEHGYGMKVSGDNPVYVQSVKEHGPAWRAGLRAGDRILRVDCVPVLHHTHQEVVHMIKENPTMVVLTVQQSSRHKRPITAPVPVNPEKQRQIEKQKAETVQLMLEKELKYIRDLRNELLKVPDVRKQAELESAEQRCSQLQHKIDSIMAGQPDVVAPSTPRLARSKDTNDKPTPNTGFLSGLPRSLSNLTGQSLRNLRQARQNKFQQENQPPLHRQNSDDGKKRHNNTVPMVPTTCLDSSPPPLPPRSIERPKRSPLTPPVTTSADGMKQANPLAMPKPAYYKYNPSVLREEFRRSSHSLDGELDGPQPNSIALQMSYPLVNLPPPPLLNDNRNSVPVMHVRSQSSPEHLDHELPRTSGAAEKEAWSRGTPPPGTPPPPYPHSTQPCSDPQRAIISMEEDDAPTSENTTYAGLFSNLRTVRDSKARMAVLINWLLGERRCPCASLVLVLTDAYRAAGGVPAATLRRWAYEIHSVFLMPNAVLHLNGVDENMANEIEHVLVNEFEKEEILRNVFRKARRQAKDELSRQLSEFQLKRQLGLATLYGPDDDTLQMCDVDKTQEVVVVERIMCSRLRAVSQGGAAGPCGNTSTDAHATVLAALVAAALCLHCRPASVAAAVGGSRPSFLQRDKLYKQRLKQLAKQHPQPFIVRGHHLQLRALTSVAHCHHCDMTIGGLAPQAVVCTDCKLRLHRECVRKVEETCCLDGEHHNNRISRFMERIHPNNMPSQDSSDRKSRKSSGTANFLNMERSFRKMEDEPTWEQTLTPTHNQGESRREGSTEEQSTPDVDNDGGESNAKEVPEKEHNWRGSSATSRGVNRAESCRERDAPRRGKHRNASDPNRLTAHPNHDLEPGAGTAPSGSSSSSSLSSRSNESSSVAAEQQDWSDEEEPLAAQWSDSLPPGVRDTIVLSARLRKRQEVIHELIVSEASHVRWLKVLGGDFLRPLERQANLLAPEELRALFPNLPSVKERHLRLYSELRTVRNEAPNHVVQIRPVADAMLNTLGEAGYSSCLAKFCRGQRMALEALRERRRKNKELHQFLAGREQLPRCGRLQLRDLLACVWQRLTKYQLLLEGILKTVTEDQSEDDPESEEDIAQLRKALNTAKDVLHSVDTAIRTSENEHRLRTIQSKLEVRAPMTPEWEELRRLELPHHSLRIEGELLVRTDTKKMTVLALMLDDSLVLLQREADRFLLKPIAHPSQNTMLSPLIKWDKVLFRPNAAMRNTFFLMNINGFQMHELSTNTAAEYSTWVRLIQESRLAETKPTLTSTHQHTRSTDDSGINVSRNPSDASEKSASSAPPDDTCDSDRDVRDKDKEREKETNDRASAEPEREKASLEREEKTERLNRSVSVETDNAEDKHRRRPTVGRITTHVCDPESEVALVEGGAVTVRPPLSDVLTAQRVLSHTERLRRLDEAISQALQAKSAVIAELLGVPPESYSHMAELAVAETMGQVDLCGDLRPNDVSNGEPDVHQLLLAAQAQANQLTEALSSALSLSETSAVRARSGRCDSCRSRTLRPSATPRNDESADNWTLVEDSRPGDASHLSEMAPTQSVDQSFDLLTDVDNQLREPTVDAAFAEEISATGETQLARNLVGVACGLQASLGRLVAALPALQQDRASLRSSLAAARERAERLAHDKKVSEDKTFPNDNVDHSIQDQPSNGG